MIKGNMIRAFFKPKLSIRKFFSVLFLKRGVAKAVYMFGMCERQICNESGMACLFSRGFQKLLRIM